jgi:hypothetical protein
MGAPRVGIHSNICGCPHPVFKSRNRTVAKHFAIFIWVMESIRGADNPTDSQAYMLFDSNKGRWQYFQPSKTSPQLSLSLSLHLRSQYAVRNIQLVRTGTTATLSPHLRSQSVTRPQYTVGAQWYHWYHCYPLSPSPFAVHSPQYTVGAPLVPLLPSLPISVRSPLYVRNIQLVRSGTTATLLSSGPAYLVPDASLHYRIRQNSWNTFVLELVPIRNAFP